MRRLSYLVIGLIAGALLNALPAHSQDKPPVTPPAYQMAPVQIQVEYDRAIYLYDCYPHAEATGLSVFLNRPTGVAIYACDWAELGWKVPMPLGSRYESVKRPQDSGRTRRVMRAQGGA